MIDTSRTHGMVRDIRTHKTYILKPTLESFVRGGPTLTRYFLGEGGSKYHHKRVIFDPPAKRQLNGVSLVYRYWPDIEYWLGSFAFFSDDPDQYY